MKKTYPTYEEAKRLVQKEGIKTAIEYNSLYKKLGLPSRPGDSYDGNGWTGWYDFLGTAIPYPSYEEAKRIVQKLGVRSSLDYKHYFKELGLPSNPDIKYKGKGWISWFEFLGKAEVSFPTYKEAQRIVQEKGIKGCEEYFSCCKELGLPKAPQEHYKNTGWVNWAFFLGKTVIQYPTYQDAKSLVQEKGLKNSKEYLSLCKELVLPSDPSVFYKKTGWINWASFLGKTPIEYPSYVVAQKIVQDKGIHSAAEYILSHKELILPSVPASYYKDDGWIDWPTFLGKSKRISHDERKYRVLVKLFVNSFLLQDDASVQLIYILVSHLDTKWAKEIEESLLGTTSYEERLNWVKEQLNKLKDGCTPIHKISYDTHSDVLSAMESIIEEFDVTDQISTTLENYLHSAVNRELISEYDN